MPRTPRSALRDGFVHAITRGNRRTDMFTCERDNRLYLEICDAAIREHGITCHAFCLMPNHVHLLLEAARDALSATMHHLNGRYAQWFNRCHQLDGHLHQDRFRAFAVESNVHLLELARYVVLNPVRCGLCTTAGEWPWSSYRATVGSAPAPPFLTTRWLLGMFGPEAPAARARFACFVEDGCVR